MPKFITLPDGSRLNPDLITTYKEHVSEGKKNVKLTLAGDSEKKTISVDMTLEEFESLLPKERNSLLSREERELIQRLVRSMDELRGTLVRMPTSIRIR